MLSQTGYSGQNVTLNVEDEGRIATTPERHAARRRRVGDGPGALHGGRRRARGCSASRLRRRKASRSPRTTRATRSSRCATGKEKVLYFEGEPRFEMKFIHRAVEDDKNMQVVILQRTAENKYWRGDVTSADELIGGFPKTREELFAYRAIILGSIEAAAFTPRAAPHAGRLRQQARRRPADARRPASVCRRRLGRHAGRRRAAGGHRERHTAAVVLRGALGAADARGRGVPGDADRRDGRRLHEQVERHGAGLDGQPGARGQAGRDDAARGVRTSGGRIRSSSPISATGAARRSRCRFRIPGPGRWTRKCRSRT